jgi:uncharacterized radical SAM superfamily protein
MKFSDWIHEIVVYKEGLKQHAHHSNFHLGKWLEDEQDRVHASNINCILVDFANPRIVKQILNVNKVNSDKKKKEEECNRGSLNAEELKEQY